MDLTEPAHDLAAYEHLGGSTRLQERQLGRANLEPLEAQLARECLDDALAVEEAERLGRLVPRRTVPCACKHAGERGSLLWLLAAGRHAKRAADLVEVHVRHAPALVVGDAAQEPGNHRAAQDGLLGGHGVEQLAVDLTLVEHVSHALGVGRVGERVGHRLVEAACAHRGADSLPQPLLAGELAEAPGTAWQGGA